MNSNLPWDDIRRETLQAVLTDLGLGEYVGRREIMVEYLQHIERDGLDALIKRLDSGIRKRGALEANTAPSGRRHKRSAAQSTSNVALKSESSVGPIPRKRARAATSASAHEAASPLSNQGRLAFDAVVIPFQSKGKAVAPISRGKAVFDGVVPPPPSKEAQKAIASMSEGEVSDDEIIVHSITKSKVAFDGVVPPPLSKGKQPLKAEADTSSANKEKLTFDGILLSTVKPRSTRVNN